MYLQLKSQLASACSVSGRRSGSSESEMDVELDDLEPAEPIQTPPIDSSQPSSQHSQTKGKTNVLGGRKLSAKSSAKSSTRIQRPVEPDAEAIELVSTMQSQHERANAIQGQISGLLAREQTSATAAWGSWIGTMAADIDPRLLPRFYRHSLDLVLGFVDESKQLPPLSVPIAQQEQQRPLPFVVPMPIPPPPLSMQQDQQGTYSATIPPLSYHGGQQGHQGQQNQQQNQGQQMWFHPITERPSASSSWDTMGPTAGQNISHATQLQRPASTPMNISSSLLPNVSDITFGSPFPATTPVPVDRQHSESDLQSTELSTL